MVQTNPTRSERSRLTKNSLSTTDILGVSLADTAPAMSFFFSFAVIAAAAGVASPLAIIVAAIAVLLKINSLAEFTKVTPSSGSYVSYIGKTFGAIPGVMTAGALAFGYIVAVGYVMAVLGAWTTLILSQFLHISVPWEPITIVLVGLVTYLVYRGVKISARWAMASFAFELLLIVVSMAAMVATNASHLSMASFNPIHIKNGLAGIGLAFPLAIFLFIGVGNPGAMVEETKNARKAVPRAIYTATIFVTVVYVLMAWTTSIVFHNNASTIANLAVPFVTAASRALGPFAILVYLAGLTSTFSSLIGATTAQTRIIFSAGREGLLPFALGKVSRFGTPWMALAVYSGFALVMTLIWASHGSALAVAGEIGTLGTIPIALVYLLLNVALPVYYLRHHRDIFSTWKHLIVPLLGVAFLILPLWGLIQPGQPYPFNIFPWIVAGLLVLGLIYAMIRQRQIPDLSQRVGSIIADE
ncbi:MAG: APC family permease [Thermaerobacter sp.]|nr:APC family permease [Thermaerobacter sp.]